MPWRANTPPLSRARLAGLYAEWLRSVGMFCVVLTFFVGVGFMLDPLLHTTPTTSIFHLWGESGLFVIGVVFVGVSLWDTLISIREGYVTTVVVLSGFGLLSCLHPLSLSGMVFYILALLATFQPTVPPRFVRLLRHGARRKGVGQCKRH